MAQSIVGICNRALQKLGAARITSLGDQSTNARACLTCYETLRDALLRDHPWNFATQRFSLAASATAPPFGRARSFPLPTGWLRPLPPDPSQNFNSRDWIVEGGSILTDDSAPLQIRCVMKIEDPTLMDALFCEALAASMAAEMAEQLTQSNEKKQSAQTDFKNAIAKAKKTNAIEKVPQEAFEDSWVTVRTSGN